MKESREDEKEELEAIRTDMVSSVSLGEKNFPEFVLSADLYLNNVEMKGFIWGGKIYLLSGQSQHVT